MADGGITLNWGRVGVLVLAGLLAAAVTSILVPIFRSARVDGKLLTCNDRLKNVGYAMMMYGLDHDDRYPPASSWGQSVLPSIREHFGDKAAEQLHCPKVESFGYGFNASLGSKEATLDARVLIYESMQLNLSAYGGSRDVDTGRHGKPGFIMCSGTLRRLQPSELAGLHW